MSSSHASRSTTPHRNQPGFILTETLIAVMLGVTLVSIAGMILFLQQRVATTSTRESELSQNARIITEHMTRDIRQATDIITSLPTSSEPPEMLAHEIQFEDGHEDQFIQYIRYYIDGTHLKRQRIAYFFSTNPSEYVRWDATNEFGGTSSTTLEDRIIAEYIDQLNIYGNGSIVIEGQLTHGAVHPFQITIYPRNN